MPGRQKSQVLSTAAEIERVNQERLRTDQSEKVVEANPDEVYRGSPGLLGAGSGKVLRD